MAKPHASKHRPARDTKRVQDIEELRARNRRLQKQVSQLRKQISRFEEPFVPEEVEAETTSKEPKCSGCGADLVAFVTPGSSVIHVCKNCRQWRAA